MTTSRRYVSAATVIENSVVGVGLPWGGCLDRGEHLVPIDLDIDFLCYNAHNPHERYHAPNTAKLQGNIYLGPSSQVYCMSLLMAAATRKMKPAPPSALATSLAIVRAMRD